MVPSASMANAQAATSRVEEIARRAFLCWFPVPRWCAAGAAGHVAEPQSGASRAVCRCPSGLTPSRAFSIGCDPDQPFR
jgi:hypothetical protein